MKPTFCASCDHVEPASRKRQPTQWLCLMHKRLEGQGFVHPDYWGKDEPFARCKDVNYGLCPLYTPIPNTDGEASDPDEWRNQMDITKDKRNASTEE